VKNIMQEAQKLQAKLLEELRKVKVEGSAGGGMVRIERWRANCYFSQNRATNS